MMESHFDEDYVVLSGDIPVILHQRKSEIQDLDVAFSVMYYYAKMKGTAL